MSTQGYDVIVRNGRWFDGTGAPSAEIGRAHV